MRTRFCLPVLVATLFAVAPIGVRASLLLDPTGGTVLWSDKTGADDAVFPARPLGFEFVFFGEDPRTTLDVSTNGNLNFDGDSAYTNEDTPGEIARISPLWDDLEVVAGSGDAIVEKTVPGVLYSVTWQVHERGNATTRHAFQVVLFGAETRIEGFDFAAGDIVFSYETLGATFAKDDATAGLDAGDGETFAPVAIATAPGGLLSRREADLLPAVPGGFVLFRWDEENAEYVCTLHTNRAPRASDDRRYVAGREPLVIDVLANDLDPDGHALTMVSTTQGDFGNVSFEPDGRVTYVPGPAFPGADAFEYTVRDPLGLTASARVLLRPFLAAKGAFAGIVLDAPPEEEEFFDDEETVVTPTASGFLQLRLSAAGGFTGWLRYGGLAHRLRGAFDALGNFRTDIVRMGEEGVEVVTVELRLETADGVNQIHGTVTDGTNFSVLAAGRNRFSARNFPAPQAGRYTVLLHPGDDGPTGIGFAVLRVAAGGAARFSGRLGDGKAFSLAAFVKPDGTLSFYLPYAVRKKARAGSLFGEVTFRDVPAVSDCDATLHWFDPGTDELPSFEAQSALVGSRYAAPARGVCLLPLPAAARNLEFDLEGEIFAMTLTAGNKVIVDEPGDAAVAMSFAPASGLFRGSFRESEFTEAGDEVFRKRTFRGVALQKMRAGGGVFVRPDGSSAVWFAPPDEEF